MALPIPETSTCYCDKPPHTISNCNKIYLLRTYTFGCHYFLLRYFCSLLKKKKHVFYVLTADWYILMLKEFREFLLNLTKITLAYYNNKYKLFVLNQLSKTLKNNLMQMKLIIEWLLVSVYLVLNSTH